MKVSRTRATSAWGRLVAISALCTLVVACGDDDDDSSSDVAATTTAPTEASVTTTAPATTAPPATAAPATTIPPTTVPPLTASYRGVTEDSIKIGVVMLDTETLFENTGVLLNWGDNQAQYQSAIDAINEAGGILGRMIEPVFVPVDPLSPTGYEEACVKLTQDDEVFAVVGFVRPADSALCYAETGDTPFIGYLSDLTSDVVARSELPIITSNALPERLDKALVSVVADAGELDGKTIAIIGNTEGGNTIVNDALEEAGFEAVSQTVTAAPTDDAVADAAEFDIVVQKWISEGVDFVFDTAGLDRLLAAANRAGFEATFATSTPSILSLSRFDSGATEAEVARTLVVAEPPVEVLLEQGHEATTVCVDRWNENHPDEQAVLFPQEGELDNLVRIARSCQQIGTFALIAERAGPELTTESFAAAVADIGSFEIAMLPFASLGADKYDANDVVSLYRWDATKKDFIAGEAVDIG